jgi:hypothetical protein
LPRPAVAGPSLDLPPILGVITGIVKLPETMGLGDRLGNAERLGVVSVIAVVLDVPGDAYPGEHRQLGLLCQAAAVVQDVL